MASHVYEWLIIAALAIFGIAAVIAQTTGGPGQTTARYNLTWININDDMRFNISGESFDMVTWEYDYTLLSNNTQYYGQALWRFNNVADKRDLQARVEKETHRRVKLSIDAMDVRTNSTKANISTNTGVYLPTTTSVIG
jgi:hypothetical protein